MMKLNRYKNILKKIFQLLFKNKKQPIDCRYKNTDPLKAVKSTNRPIMINIPVEKIRINRWLALKITNNSIHPYVATINEYLNNNYKAISYKDSILKKYYDFYKPVKVDDILGLVPSIVEDEMDPLHYSSPWGPLRGKPINPLNYGYQWWGPRTKEWGSRELQRIHNLVNSINSDGFIPSPQNGYIEGYLLIDKSNNYFITIERGHHRAAVLSCLGYNEIPVVINKDRVVKEEDVLKWPTVKMGMLTEREALKVFERIKKGIPPIKLKNIWADNISK